ncbi:MAG: histidine kinase dimerization/phosphoacceptor domain -containing protein [Saprospiraceae bacterium]
MFNYHYPIITLFALLFLPTVASSQKVDLPPLYEQLNQLAETDPARVEIYVTLAEKHRYVQFDSMAVNIEKALVLAKQTQSDELMTNANYVHFKYYSGDQKLDTLRQLYEFLAPRLPKYRAKLGQAQVKFMEADIAVAEKQVDKAVRLYLEAAAIAEQAGESDFEADCYVQVSRRLMYSGNMEEGLIYSKKAAELFQQIGNQKSYTKNLSNLINLYRFAGDTENMLFHLNEAITANKEFGLPVAVGNAHLSASIYYIDNEDPLDAVPLLEVAAENYQAASDTVGYNMAIGNIGTAYHDAGQSKLGLPYIMQQVEAAKNTDNLFLLFDFQHTAAEAYASIRQFDSAYYLMVDAYRNHDQLFNDQSFDQIKELTTRYETRQKEATIQLQNAQISRQRLILWMGGGFSLLLLGGGSVLYNFNKKLQQRNREKEVLMKEIHHRVKNNLQMIASLLSLQSMHIEDEVALSAVQASQQRVESVGILHKELYSRDNITQVKMDDYLPVLTDNLEDAFLSDGRIKIIHVVEPIELDVETAIPIGLIVNELVTNALKYAFKKDEKGEIKVNFQQLNNQHYRLSVADNGQGMQAQSEQVGTSFGTKLIGILAQQLSAEMRKESDENGFKVELEW